MAVIRKRSRRIKRGKGTSTKLYFDKNTHNSIVKFQQSECNKEKEDIYVNQILPAFSKLAENLIFMHGFAKNYDSYESLRDDCVAFLYETLGKFDASRGTKAFSYFNVVAKNWLIIQSKKTIKSRRRHVSIDDSESLSQMDIRKIESYQSIPGQDAVILKREAIADLFRMMTQIRKKLHTENELACMAAIITLFSNIQELDFLNKRAVFVYMRDLSSLNPKQLSVAMSVIRKHYRDLSKSPDFDIFF